MMVLIAMYLFLFYNLMVTNKIVVVGYYLLNAPLLWKRSLASFRGVVL